MKIAIFSDNFYPELSGISDSIILLAQGLAKRGHQICFVVPQYSARDYRRSNVPQAELDLGDNITFCRLFSVGVGGPTKQARLVIPFGQSYKYMKSFAPDIIHTQLFFGVGLEALRVAKRLKISLVGTNHTPVTEFVKYFPVSGRWIESESLRYVNWYYNQCAAVTMPSDSILQEMKACGFEKNAQVVSNPIDVNGFQAVSVEKKLAFKKKFGLLGQTILYTGRLAPEKNVDVLLRAFALVVKNCNDVDLVITGHGTSRENLEILAHELHIEDKVKFLGTVESVTLKELYSAADIFAIASTAETQCLSLMNAFASRLPVVGVRARALGEYITPDVGFVVEPGDFVTMAHQLQILLKDAALREKFGSAGVLKIQKFSVENILIEWENIYNSVL